MSSHYLPADINFYKNIIITKETVIDLKGATYQAEKIKVKQGHPLADRIAELLPQCKNFLQHKRRGHSLSAEEAVRKTISEKYNAECNRETIEFNGIRYFPDCLLSKRGITYYFEIKSTTLGLDREKAECLRKIAGLQSLRLASVVALTKGVEVLPKIALGQFNVIERESGKVMLKRVIIYRVGMVDTFEVDNELAVWLYKLIESERAEVRTLLS
jgi:hypothetical protein